MAERPTFAGSSPSSTSSTLPVLVLAASDFGPARPDSIWSGASCPVGREIRLMPNLSATICAWRRAASV